MTSGLFTSWVYRHGGLGHPEPPHLCRDLALNVYPCLTDNLLVAVLVCNTTLEPLLAVLAKVLHVRDVLGEVLLPVLLQVLLVALEQFGSTALRGVPTSGQAGP